MAASLSNRRMSLWAFTEQPLGARLAAERELIQDPAEILQEPDMIQMDPAYQHSIPSAVVFEVSEGTSVKGNPFKAAR